MFEILDRVELPVAEEALYHLGLRLYERKHFPDWRRWLSLRTSEILAPESIDVAASVLGEVECRTRTALGEMDDDLVAAYERAIRLIVSGRRKAERPVLDPERGRRLLEELRRDYGDVSRRVA